MIFATAIYATNRVDGFGENQLIWLMVYGNHGRSWEVYRT